MDGELEKIHGIGAATVVVLYNPDAATIDHAQRLARSGFNVVVVSNGVDAAQRASLRDAPLVAFIDNPDNFGLARALNQGIDAALQAGAEHVLLLDQDSRPPPTLLADLIAAVQALPVTGSRVGCVAPLLVDRKRPAARVGARGKVATVATSGSLLSRSALMEAGRMWEPLFIDGVDHEWCFRARAAGYEIAIVPPIELVHDMGDAGVHLFGRFRPVHRSPFRHYHIVRNTLWLARRPYIPWRWRMKECVKTLYRMPVYLLVSRDRRATLGALGRALRDGLFRRPDGPAPR